MRDAVPTVALLVVSALLLVPARALADVPATASSTWQTNGIVYAIAYARGNVYIGASDPVPWRRAPSQGLSRTACVPTRRQRTWA
jgi:hypothetical protein